MLQNQVTTPSVLAGDLTAQDADRLVQRATETSLNDGGLQTSELLKQALDCDPTHHDAQVLQERLHQMCVPRWHFPMLADQARNRAYARAIAAKVRPGDVVLDIGCGAGLTAMLAARAGAKHVYTCEQQPLIADVARRVIADNGLSEKITVLSKWSHDIVIGTDMPEPADVVISEIVDTVLLGEGALATLTHAMAALAKPGARALPERGVLQAQVVHSDALVQQWRPAAAEGFDLRAFQALSQMAQLTPNDFAASDLRALGPVTDLFSFDFTQPSLKPGRVTADLACHHTGQAHAVMVSFQMVLAPGISVSNDLEATGHWGRTAFLLDQPLCVAPGARLRLTAQHDAAHLSLRVNDLYPAMQDAQTAKIWQSAIWSEGAAAPPLAALAPVSAGAGQGAAYPH